MSANNSKPKELAPVVVLREEPSNMGRYLLLFVPALLGSVLFHVALIVAFFLYIWMQPGETQVETVVTKTENVNAESVEEKKETFTVVDVDPAATEFDTDIQYMGDRIADVSVPGTMNPNEAIGIRDGDKSAPPVNIAAPGGFGSKGQGGAIETSGPGNSMAVGEIGGYGPRGMPLQGSFYGRSGATRENALRDGGGTTASEAAVTRGLQWLIRQQMTDGRWRLTPADPNEIAATGLGLLPFLAAGKTHKPEKNNPYDKNIDKALKFLMRSQDPKTGFYGGSMYSHGIATIAICEAYGLSQDPTLRRSAQGAINLIVSTQGEQVHGWGYGPDKTSAHRDLSISGWQIMALKSGQMAGLVVPTVTIDRTKRYLDASSNPTDDGYGYTPGSGSSYRMTAVGLLCRQYMQNWGPSNPAMIKAVKNFIKTNPPERQDVYYYYYATQVMHHFGGEAWRDWNDKMREILIKKQESNTKSANFGSWSPEGDPWGGSGGRLMITSLNLLTLEVYYRYLPLYYRDAGYGKDAAVQKAL